MAGNGRTPGEKTGDGNGPSGSKPSAKTFSCTNCGASITVRYMGHSLSVVCESCRAVLDARDENLRIIDTYSKATSAHVPKLALGSRGKLKGREWEVIGFVVRQDTLSYYAWQEYLLFNPYYGYRWLTLNNGHWSFVTMLKRKPETRGGYYAAKVRTATKYEGNTYKLYYTGSVSVLFVLGEFYWNVKAGSSVNATDYICPPYMLSREGDEYEQVWSQAEYIDAREVEKAFKPEEQLPRPVGIAPNQPTESKKVTPMVSMLWATFVIILICLQSVQMAGARSDRAFAKTYYFVTDEKNPTLTTPVFELVKKKANLEININADVDNSWFYVYGELVNDDNDTTYTFEKTIEYYHGYSGGESWTEGSRHKNILISAVPGGKYYMNLYTQSGDYKKKINKYFDIQVVRDVKTFANFFWCLLGISFVPVILWFRTYSDEVARWSDSDFSPYASDD